MKDSIDKIVMSYFALVTSEDFVYKGKIYKPKKIIVSPLLFRGYTCPANCGGCCPKFSLDYLPTDNLNKDLKKRKIIFNNKSILIYSDTQEDNNTGKCKNLNLNNGRCNIHTNTPFSCDFELIRTLIFEDPDRPNILMQKLYGRGWNMLRVDNKRGALCEMLPPSNKSIEDVLIKIKKLQNWCNHFQLKNKCDDIIYQIEKFQKNFNHKLF